MKRLVLISTFCDSQEKIDVFAENIKKIKSVGLDIMALGPNWLKMPEELINECDFFFYTKENPLVGYPIRRHTHWCLKAIEENRDVVLHKGFDDYGWASLYQIRKLIELGLTFDYDSFCITIYDTVITDQLLAKLLDEKNNILHKRIDPKDSSIIVDSAHFVIVDREKASLIKEDIVYDNYDRVHFAEDFPKKWSREFGITYEEPHITDKIYHWENQPPTFDYQIHKDFKFFISKHPDETIIRGIWQEQRKEDLSGNIRMVFYDFINEDVEKKEITVEVNGLRFDFFLRPWVIVELPISSQDVKLIKIHTGEETFDLTDTYRKISFNQIYYNYDI